MRTLGKLVRGMPPDHPIRVLRDDVRLAFERRNGLVHSVVVRQVMHDGQPSEPLWFHPKTLALTPVNEGVAADLLADLNELARSGHLAPGRDHQGRAVSLNSCRSQCPVRRSSVGVMALSRRVVGCPVLRLRFGCSRSAQGPR